MKKGYTELVFILDRSGSMGGLESDTIGGYNAMLAKQRSGEGECRITTVLFDNTYELLHDRIDIKTVSAMTKKEYCVGGSTALLDAIGRTIHEIRNVQQGMIEDYCAEKTLFIIITDGEENASREYSASQVKNQIAQQKEKCRWEFIFLGANIDAVETAGHFGIAPNRAVDYLADHAGTKLNFAMVSEAVSEFRANSVISEVHFEQIRQDVRARGDDMRDSRFHAD